MKKSSAFILSFIIFLLTACNQPTSTGNNAADDGSAAISADSIKQYISVLAADSFMGRKPFTEGETKTVAYLQKQFAALAIEPGNGNSYLQDVPMVNILATAAPQMQVTGKKGNFTLKAFDDYIIWTDK